MVVKKKSTVKFASKLSMLSSESIQTDGGIELHSEEDPFKNDNLPEEEEPLVGVEYYPPIRIEYTTKRDSIKLNRCLIKPKPPRENVPFFLRHGTDSKTSGYTFKTNFIGDTKIISVTPAECHKDLGENPNFMLRTSLLRLSETLNEPSNNLRHETMGTSDTDSRKRSLLSEEFLDKINRNMRTIDKESKFSNGPKPISSGKRIMNETHPFSDGNLSSSDLVPSTNFQVSANVPKLHQNKVHVEAAIKPIPYSERLSPNKLLGRFENKIIDPCSASLDFDDKNKDSLLPRSTKLLEEKISQRKSVVLCPVPSNEAEQRSFMSESEVNFNRADDTQLCESQEFRISIGNNQHQIQNQKVSHNEPSSSRNIPPKIIKPSIPDSSSSSNKMHRYGQKSVESSVRVSGKFQQSEDVLKIPTIFNNKHSNTTKFTQKFSANDKARRYIISTQSLNEKKLKSIHKSSGQLKESENDDLVFSRKALTVKNDFGKRSFNTKKYVFDDATKFSKQPVHLSLQVTEGNKHKPNYKIIMKQRQIGLKDDINAHMSKFEFTQGIQQLPQIAPLESIRVKLHDETRNFNSDKGKSSETHGQLKLPDLRKSLSRLTIRQHKKNSVVMSYPKRSYSSSKLDETLIIQNKNRKLKLKEKLLLDADLFKLEQLKKQLVSSYVELAKPKKFGSSDETTGSRTKVSSASHSLVDETTFTKKTIAPITQSIDINRSKPHYETSHIATSQVSFNKFDDEHEFEIIEELDPSYFEDAQESILKENEMPTQYNEPFWGEDIEMVIRSTDYQGEQVYAEEASFGDFRNFFSEQILNSPISSQHGEDDTTDKLSLFTSIGSSDFHSENLQNMVKDYLMRNITDGLEEMEDVKFVGRKKSTRKRGLSQNFGYKYKGTYDVNDLRTGFGCLQWDARESRTYCGYFLYNSLHGKGHYFIKEDKCLNFYNGHLFGNKLHGYGQIVHDNGDTFEGLFKHNARFGPGVFTHPNGTQDVGIWYGHNLLRLNIDLSASIPSFSKSIFGKIKLMQLKRVLSLKIPLKDKAQEILENLKADEKTVSRYKELYNPYVRNENSLFFDKSEYDETYFRNEDIFIDISRSWKSHKNTPNAIVTKNSDENVGMNEERIELIKTIESVENKLTNFRKQIEDLQNKHEFNPSINGSISLSVNFVDEKEKNKLYKEELFYSSVLDFLKYKLNTCEQRFYAELPAVDQKVRVDSLLALNNNDILVDILLHTFRCRNSEENIRFEVKSIFIGDRGNFGKSGEHEQSCEEFLDYCRSGDSNNALKLLVKQNINPDVCDSRGNSGLHFASCFDHVNIIQILANNGANLGIMNDEGLVPLNLALLRYLELICNVRNWEFAFLSKHEVSQSEKRFYSEWIPYESFLVSIPRTTSGNRRFSFLSNSLSANNVRVNRKVKTSRKSNLPSQSSPGSFLNLKTTNLFKDLIPDSPDRFIFSLEYNPRLMRVSSNTASNANSTELAQKIFSKLNEENVRSSKEVTKNLLGITRTIEMLLQYGADPNNGAVPFSPFFISLFTKSSQIVEMFLRNKANPNQFYYGMTPLQIVCCLEPCYELCQMVNTMIKYSADVDLLSDPFVWKECNNDLSQNYIIDYEIEPCGKNALHFICLREDFTDFDNVYLCRMAEMLLGANIKTSTLYLGHSHLSIAVLKGNMELIKCLSKFVDIRRSLGFGLGNALTVLALRRYPYLIPFNACKKIIDCLFDLGISPFEPLYNHQNILEFLDTDSPPLLENSVHSWNAYVSHNKRYLHLLNKTPDEPVHANCNIISKIYIQEKSRIILNRIIRFKAVFYLYSFFRETLLSKHTTYLAKLIGTSNEALINLEVLFRCGKLPQSYFSIEIVVKLMEYVDGENRNPRNKEMKYDVAAAAGRMKWKYISDNPELKRIAEWVSDENILKSDVCYFCMHKKDKILLRCPSCGIVKFCSKQCNYLSSKFKTIHACSILFYHGIFKENKIFINNNQPVPLYGIDLVFENARKRESKISSVQIFLKLKFPQK